MSELLTRSQVPVENRWRIEDIYSDEEEWEKECNEFEQKLSRDCIYKGHLKDSQDKLLEFIEQYDREDEQLEKLYVYAYLRLYENMGDDLHQRMAGRIHGISTRFAQKYAFAEPELLNIPENVLRQWMQDKLSPYSHYIEDILIEKPHTLSSEQEELLAAAHMMSSAARDIFQQFNNSDISFGMITDEDGNSVKLTSGTFIKYMESRERRVRQDAMAALYSQYKAYINTLAAAYDANVKQARFFAKARKYSSTLEMYLSQNNIPVNVYTNLIDAVNSGLSLMHRYVRLRKKALHVEELHMYDIYAPMTADYQMRVEYNEAKSIVMQGLSPLGDEYVRLIKEGFDSGWVDVYENKGKRTGAFSWGAYGTHPYVSLNYAATLNDVFTIAHEMGHSMHTYYSNSNQPHIYAGYRIFVAEVASTCNEALLIRYMLDNCRNRQEKIYLLNHYLEQFKGTLFRQTMFAEFEMATHAMSERGEVLNAQNLNRIYRELNAKYFGKDMVIDDDIELEWARIPHFYTPFYVYQYATGFCAAIAIASGLLNDNENEAGNARKGYMKFLSGGSSLHPLELLELCGIDMSTSRPVQDALDVFEGLLDEMEELI